MKNVFYYNLPIGKIKIADNGTAITDIYTIKEIKKDENLIETDLIKKAHIQLVEYFEKKRTEFDLPLYFEGTDFQKKVWEALINIPYGITRTYKQIAEEIGCPKGCRAVGNANNKNKVMIVVPCHRVIGTNGALVGYAGGLDLKQTLLTIEKNI